MSQIFGDLFMEIPKWGRCVVGRCTEHYELLAANHRQLWHLWLGAFGAELETRLGVHRTEPS